MSWMAAKWTALDAGLQGALISTGWILIVTVLLILSVAFTTLWERKVIGWMQLRRGPNRVGSIFGLLPGVFQPFADVIKLLLKEVIILIMAIAFLCARLLIMDTNIVARPLKV